MSEHLLEVKDLHVEFDTGRGVVPSVRGVTFHVEPGEILGLVGESGSGKSVSMLACMGLLAPNSQTRGQIIFDGEELLLPDNATRAERKAHEHKMQNIRGNRIGMIFQDPLTYLNPVLSIGTQVTEGIFQHTHCSRKEAWERGISLLEDMGIPSAKRRMHQYPHEFSGGMRQRIVIATAFACNPELLIADEPTTALDVTVQAQILELIRERARRRNISVLLITHDLGVVASLCDRIAIFYGGRIAETGTTDEIFYHAQHPYTLGLLGSIAGKQLKKGMPLSSIPGSPPDPRHAVTGCPFTPRCPKAMKICRDYLPTETSFSPSHCADCWLYCKEQAKQRIQEQDRMRGDVL